MSPVLCFFSLSEGRIPSLQTVETIWVPQRTSFRVNGIKKLVTESCSTLRNYSMGKTKKTPLSITQHSQRTLSHPVLHTRFPNFTSFPGSSLVIQCLQSRRLNCFLDKHFFSMTSMSLATLGPSAQLHLRDALFCFHEL